MSIIAKIKAWFASEPKKLEAEVKTEVVDVEAKVAEAKAKVKVDVLKVIEDIKAWEAKEVVTAKAAITQFEARVKQIL
jgi:hypothetical protein